MYDFEIFCVSAQEATLAFLALSFVSAGEAIVNQWLCVSEALHDGIKETGIS
jgi:hypothetical protein